MCLKLKYRCFIRQGFIINYVAAISDFLAIYKIFFTTRHARKVREDISVFCAETHALSLYALFSLSSFKNYHVYNFLLHFIDNIFKWPYFPR